MKPDFVKGFIMGMLIIILFTVFVMIVFGPEAFAGEKEELALKAQAVVMKVQLKQAELQLAVKEQIEFAKELDAKGYQLYQNGTIAEKPKPPEKKSEPSKK